ncbi:MAG: glycosyltransferase family 39 protein [Pirellulales bacterium]|nr:glycosyltransferase family 39 protein [Pirellulales bacterium]
MTSLDAKKLAFLLLFALVLRLAAGVWWQSRVGPGFGFADSESYWALGRAVASGEPYRFGAADSRVFRAPGYPVLLAPIFLLGGAEPPIFWARALGAFLGTLSVAGVWWLARRLFGSLAGWIAGVMAAVYPGAIATSVFVLSEAPFCPLMLANLALWILAWQAGTLRRACWLAAAAGTTAGAATLVRPSWLLFLPFALAAGLIFGGPAGPTIAPADTRPMASRRRHLLLGTVMTLGMVLVMCPWWIRNARAVGRFVPTTLEVGASLYDGLNPGATGGSRMAFVDRFIDQERCHPSHSDEPLEIRLDRRMRDEALTWARAHPGQAARLAGVKFLRMWNIWANEAGLSSWPFRLVVMLTYVPVLILGILGAVGTLRRGLPYWLCWLPAVYFTLLHVVFVSSIRYRQPAMLGLIVLAAGLIAARRREEASTEGCSRWSRI